jgi:hypothetical protein
MKLTELKKLCILYCIDTDRCFSLSLFCFRSLTNFIWALCKPVLAVTVYEPKWILCYSRPFILYFIHICRVVLETIDIWLPAVCLHSSDLFRAAVCTSVVFAVLSCALLLPLLCVCILIPQNIHACCYKNCLLTSTGGGRLWPAGQIWLSKIN